MDTIQATITGDNLHSFRSVLPKGFRLEMIQLNQRESRIVIKSHEVECIFRYDHWHEEFTDNDSIKIQIFNVDGDRTVRGTKTVLTGPERISQEASDNCVKFLMNHLVDENGKSVVSLESIQLTFLHILRLLAKARRTFDLNSYKRTELNLKK